MKRTATKQCSFILITVLLTTMLPSRVYAVENIDEPGEGEEFPEFSAIDYSEELDAGETEEEFPEGSSADFDDETGDEGEIVIPDDAESDLYDDDELDIEDGEEVYAEDSPIFEDEELSGTDDYVDEITSDIIIVEEEQDEELNASNPWLSVSTTKLVVQKGNSSSFTITYHDLNESAYLEASRSESLPVGFSFGNSWSGTSLPLNITANGVGSGSIIVYLRSASTDAILSYVVVAVSTYSNPSVTASKSSVSLYEGDSDTVTFSCSGVAGSIYLRYGTTNSQSYNCSWGSWQNWTLPLTITGKSAGSGYVTVYLYDGLTDKMLASTKISVKVMSKQPPKITLSKSSVSVTAGSSAAVNVSVSNMSSTMKLSFGQTNSSAFSCEWGKWSGSTMPLTVTGKAKGTGTVYVYVLNQYNETLASASFKVSVNENAKITVSKSSITVKTEASASVNCTVSGVSGKWTVQYGTTNNNAFSCAWGTRSGNTVPIKITGKNKGSGKITVYLRDADGKALSSATISVTVEPGSSPGLKVSTNKISLAVGKSTTIPVTITNAAGDLQLQFYYADDSLLSCSWGKWSGSTNPLTVKGLKNGKGTIKIYLRKLPGGTAIASAEIAVTVTGGASAIQQLSYNFENFGSIAPLTLCKKMFGDNEYAKAVYRRRIGSGGNCFGFAATSGMFNTDGNGVSVPDFNSSASWVYQLGRRDSSKTYKTNVQRFIEALQISQVSRVFDETDVEVSELGSLISTVSSEKKSGRPVMLCVYGPIGYYFGGHAVIAYDVQEVDKTHTRLLIYDSNHALKTRYFDIYKDSSGRYKSWSFNLWDGLTWRSDYYGELSYAKHGMYYQLWQKRGNLSSSNVNMFISNSMNFELYDVNDKLAASVENGKLVDGKEGVEQIVYCGVMPGSNKDYPCILYLPVELYTLKNTDKNIDKLDVHLVNEELGVQVTTSGDEMSICADDSCNLASVLLDTDQGNDYQILMSSSKEGDPESIEWAGASDGEMISIILDKGELQMLNADDANVTVGETNGGSEDKYYSISVEAGEHGAIVSDGGNLVPANEDRLYTITPDSGYEIEDVKVDGNSVGAVSSYTFENVDANHTISATFRSNMPLPGKTTRGDMFNLANNVKVTWKEVSGAKYYKVYREGITDSKETRKDPVIVTSGLVGWDSDPGLTNGHAYRYKIVASLTGKGDSSGDSKLSYSKVMYRLKTVVIRSVKNTEPGKVTVKYDRTTAGDSYVLQYSERQDMVGAKTKVVLGANNTAYVIGGLKKGKTYYISIRVRKKVNGIDYYTTFGVPKKVTVTK